MERMMPFDGVLLDSHGEWYLALQFKMDSETEVWKEVINTLSSEFVSNNMSSTEFRIVVQNHIDRFPKGGLVRDWLAGHLSSIVVPVAV